MPLYGATALVTGGRGLLARRLGDYLRALGGRVLHKPGDVPVRYLFHLWSKPDEEDYEEAVAGPLATAVKLAPSLSHLCLLRGMEDDGPGRALEISLGILARRHRFPFAVVLAPDDAALGPVAAFIADSGIAGRVKVSPPPEVKPWT